MMIDESKWLQTLKLKVGMFFTLFLTGDLASLVFNLRLSSFRVNLVKISAIISTMKTVPNFRVPILLHRYGHSFEIPSTDRLYLNS